MKYPGWMKIASKCDTFEDARRYSENQALCNRVNYEQSLKLLYVKHIWHEKPVNSTILILLLLN